MFCTNYMYNKQCIIDVLFHMNAWTFEKMASQTIKIPDDDFKCLSQSNLRYHRVFQTSRANNNDLLFPRSKIETICIIDVALIYYFDSYSFPNLPNGIYLCYLYFAIFHLNNIMFNNFYYNSSSCMYKSWFNIGIWNFWL